MIFDVASLRPLMPLKQAPEDIDPRRGLEDGDSDSRRRLSLKPHFIVAKDSIAIGYARQLPRQFLRALTSSAPPSTNKHHETPAVYNEPNVPAHIASIHPPNGAITSPRLRSSHPVYRSLLLNNSIRMDRMGKVRSLQISRWLKVRLDAETKHCSRGDKFPFLALELKSEITGGILCLNQHSIPRPSSPPTATFYSIYATTWRILNDRFSRHPKPTSAVRVTQQQPKKQVSGVGLGMHQLPCHGSAGLPLLSASVSRVVLQLSYSVVVKEACGEMNQLVLNTERAIYKRLTLTHSSPCCSMYMGICLYSNAFSTLYVRGFGISTPPQALSAYRDLPRVRSCNTLQVDAGTHNALLDWDKSLQICDFAGCSFPPPNLPIKAPSTQSEIFALGVMPHAVIKLYRANEFPATSAPVLEEVVTRCYRSEHKDFQQVMEHYTICSEGQDPNIEEEVSHQAGAPLLSLSSQSIKSTSTQRSSRYPQGRNPLNLERSQREQYGLEEDILAGIKSSRSSDPSQNICTSYVYRTVEILGELVVLRMEGKGMESNDCLISPKVVD
ncbi:uncharacterized protein BDR25DRAFT_349261 [Lindgomyces ingoldianus]|uniref:Uncharacterized protein n=1 Tax=Lindgomyces ingoldianus TaxID=673940 RepID=A0ACB6RE64_9PLEO|nr:uncharacterized protein BDR25DRAFT_349261 [Lindgomyces ingoldianus]KAF2477330.1 hypothetical protein BDR25DRAFT_349261 [Lindgomyces ingoldianus]